MKNVLTLIILLFGLTLYSGCCNKADCDINGGYFQIRLLKDGKNALFGPDAFIVEDSISIYHLDHPEIESYFDLSDTLQTIQFWVEERSPIVLKLNSTRLDTFSVTTKVMDNRCCPIIEVTSLIRNGQIICTEECEDLVIGVEI